MDVGLEPLYTDTIECNVLPETSILLQFPELYSSHSS